MSELEKDLDSIERMYVDPNLTLMRTTVIKINDLLAAEPQSSQKLIDITNNLNALWRENGFHGQTFFATGYMHVGENYEPVSYVSLDNPTTFRNQKIISRGFFAHIEVDESAMVDDNAALAKQSILMKGRTLIEDESGVEGMSELACALDMRSAHLMYPEMTPARAAAWLEFHCSEIKTELDAILLDSNSEIEATMALKDVEIDVQNMKKGRIHKLIQHLCHWMIGELKYDKHFPYAIAVDGEIDIFDPIALERKTTTVNDVLYAKLKELIVSHDETSHTLQFGIQSEIINGMHEVSRPTQIPLSVIQEIQPTLN